MTIFRELCCDRWVYGACTWFVSVEQQLILCRVKVGLEMMVHADRTNTCLEMTSYTNVELQNNAYCRGGVCLLTSGYYVMKPEKRMEQLT